MLNKKDLAKIIADKRRTTFKEELDHLNLVFDTIEEILKEKKSINIVGFGAFKTIERQPRKIINPKTGEIFPIGKRKVFKFVQGKHIRDLYK